jgi:hypothetical protein
VKTSVEFYREELNALVSFKETKFKTEQEIFEQALEMERDQLILFGAQCIVESEKESGLGTIRIYELYFDRTFKPE